MTQYEKDVMVFLLIIISIQSIYIFSQWLYKDEPKLEKIMDIEMTMQESPEQIPAEQLEILTKGELYGTNI